MLFVSFYNLLTFPELKYKKLKDPRAPSAPVCGSGQMLAENRIDPEKCGKLLFVVLFVVVVCLVCCLFFSFNSSPSHQLKFDLKKKQSVNATITHPARLCVPITDNRFHWRIENVMDVVSVLVLLPFLKPTLADVLILNKKLIVRLAIVSALPLINFYENVNQKEKKSTLITARVFHVHIARETQKDKMKRTASLAALVLNNRRACTQKEWIEEPKKNFMGG